MIAAVQKIFQVFAMVRGLLSLVEPIKELIELVEAIYQDEKGMGAEKKEKVLTLLEEALKTGEEAFSIQLPKESVLGFASVLIDLLVQVFNVRGWFKFKDDEKTAKKS